MPNVIGRLRYLLKKLIKVSRWQFDLATDNNFKDILCFDKKTCCELCLLQFQTQKRTTDCFSMKLPHKTCIDHIPQNFYQSRKSELWIRIQNPDPQHFKWIRIRTWFRIRSNPDLDLMTKNWRKKIQLKNLFYLFFSQKLQFTFVQASVVERWLFFYGSGSDCWKVYGSSSGSDLWKVMVPVPTFEKLRFRFQLHI